MGRNNLNSTILILLIGFFIGCNTESLEPNTERVGFDFFPLKVGNFRIYQVKEITINILNGFDTAEYQLKEVLVDSFPGQTGDIIYLLNRLRRNSSADQWELDSVWSTRINDYQAVVTESNVPYIKLVFPVMENKQWDGNKLNSKEIDTYEMRNLFTSFSTGIETFDKTLSVIQNEKFDSIDVFDYRKEIYGLNIGLINKQISYLEFCNDVDCLGEKKIENGRILEQTILSYGEE